MLLQKPVHHFLVFVRRFRVAAQLVVSRAARKERSLGMHARQSSRRHKILVFVSVALELRNLFQFFRAQNAAALRLVRFVPGEAWYHPIVHSDIQIGQHENRSLEALGQVECFGSELKTLVRIAWEQQNVFGIAMRCVGAFQNVALLRAGGHAGGRTHALNIDNHRGYFSVIRQAEQFIHQRNAGTGGGGESPRAIPRSANYHSDSGQLVLGLNDDVVVLSGLGIAAILLAESLECIQHGC